MLNKKSTLLLFLSLFVAILAASPVYAEGNTAYRSTSNGNGWGTMMKGTRGGFGLRGTVATVNGSTFTLTTKKLNTDGVTLSTQTYMVNASNATVTKNGSTSTVSNILVGDTVMVSGTITGTSVVAKTVRDGFPAVGMGRGNKIGSLIQGNGQPVVGGKVTVVSGNTITILNSSNVTYSIDATNAKIEKEGVISSISSIAIGDSVIVQGTVNGTTITAASIIDSQIKVQVAEGTTTNGNQGKHKGFFGSIGGFLAGIFGF